jgi:Pyruvate/2-oxoacid:ferredoxin oxidoreductase delta subunit
MQPKKVVIKRLSELPIMPSTIGTMEWNQTGDWRYLTPQIRNRPAPCGQNCPAGVPIPDYLRALKAGDFRTGLALLLSYNPLPGLTGRFCYHPCQTKCLRQRIDSAIPIQKIEQFMGKLGADLKEKQNRENGKQVTVVGSGPLGLSCAFFLGCRGVHVSVLESRRQAGGEFADLPAKKLDRDVLEQEISRLVRVGNIHLETGVALDLENLPKSLSKSDLVILDPTGLPDKYEPPGANILNPFVDQEVRGGVLAVTLPGNLRPFKAAMVAHYVTAGRLAADKAAAYLSRNAEDMETTHVGSFLDANLCLGGEAEQEETWEGGRVLRESERCMSCGICNLCLQCASSCPEACLRLDAEKNTITVDLDFCKGCGICAYECPRWRKRAHEKGGNGNRICCIGCKTGQGSSGIGIPDHPADGHRGKPRRHHRPG